MTDLTDQDRRVAHEWAASIDPDMKCWSDRERVAARVILATVDAPGPTLAEELRELGVLLEEEGGAGAKSTVWARDLAVRAEQIEQERDEARAEVERLRATHPNVEGTRHGFDIRHTMQKGAESTAETPDPADVEPGEAWVVEVGRERRNALKDNSFDTQWNTVNADGWPVVEHSEDITLISRLVPATRADTAPHHQPK